MFKKVLLVEDEDTVSYGIRTMLEQELGIDEVVIAKYCDEAYLKFQIAHQSQRPYELLISDLSFIKDHTPLQLDSGKALIEKIRASGHYIPIIICSVEKKPNMIKHFIETHQISAYVLKGRNGLRDLKKAVHSVYHGSNFLSEKVEQLAKGKNTFEIANYDTSLLKHLSQGLTQDQISVLFKTEGVSPSSLSSIEKRLNRLKDILMAHNNVQLVANAKDLGLI